VKTLKTTVLADGFYLLEGPRWNNGVLWMSDMVGRKVYQLALDGRVEIMAKVPHRPSGLGFLPDGTLLGPCGTAGYCGLRMPISSAMPILVISR
jgi:sugar lactone lactonase YvrE